MKTIEDILEMETKKNELVFRTVEQFIECDANGNLSDDEKAEYSALLEAAYDNLMETKCENAALVWDPDHDEAYWVPVDCNFFLDYTLLYDTSGRRDLEDLKRRYHKNSDE